MITAVVLWFVATRLAEEWKKVRSTPTEALHPRWALVALSCLVVFATYAILIETMRRLIVAWGERLSFIDAARIWSLSGLARYLPANQFFSIGAVAELARRRRVSPAAAAGAALINTALNIATGFVVALAAGWSAVNKLSNGHARLGILLVACLGVSVLIFPLVLPFAFAMLGRLTGRVIPLGTLSRRAVYVAIAGNILSWLMYGLAYQIFVAGLVGRWGGSTLSYIAVWAMSYLLGYLAFLLPAGIGVREGAQTEALTTLGLLTVGPALVVPVFARLWLTVLELVPAVVFLAYAARIRSQKPKPLDGATP